MQNNNNIITSIGIDVSKNKLDICLLKGDCVKYLTVSNNSEGIDKLKDYLKETIAPIIIESTSSYHLKAVLALQDKYNVKLINPFIFKSYSNISLRKTKTDKRDSLILAQIGLSQKDLVTRKLNKEQLELKEKYRLRNYLVSTRSKYKNKLSKIKVLSKDLNILMEEEIVKKLIKDINKQIRALEKFIINSNYVVNKLAGIGTIPGVSPVSLAGLIIELGDLSIFKDVKQVNAIAGIDPSIRESGTSIHATGKISKRGSSSLRRLVFLIGWGLATHNKHFKDYYNKKRSEGKHYFTCLIATGRKFLGVFYKLMVTGNKYDINYRGLT